MPGGYKFASPPAQGAYAPPHLCLGALKAPAPITSRPPAACTALPVRRLTKVTVLGLPRCTRRSCLPPVDIPGGDRDSRIQRLSVAPERFPGDRFSSDAAGLWLADAAPPARGRTLTRPQPSAAASREPPCLDLHRASPTPRACVTARLRAPSPRFWSLFTCPARAARR